MTLKSALYYWVECDHPGCGEKSTENGDYSAWADHGSAYDEAFNSEWSSIDGVDLCSQHAPPRCCNCSELATTEHDQDIYCDGCLAAEVVERGITRPSTPTVIHADGRRTITVQRACNGCGRSLGDATHAELEAAMYGPLPDVRAECGCKVQE